MIEELTENFLMVQALVSTIARQPSKKPGFARIYESQRSIQGKNPVSDPMRQP
jgi:hypothetical protein